MPGLFVSLEPTRVARADLYMREWAWLKSIGRPEDFILANDMEHAIIANDGYPIGSSPLRSKLQLFNMDDWQEVIKWLEAGCKGDASLALHFIEFQRAYQISNVAIIYSVVPFDRTDLILFDSINFPRRPIYC